MDNMGETMNNIQSTIDSKGAGPFTQAELFFADLFIGKLPPLSEQIRDVLVKIAPYWAICLIAFGLLRIIFGSLAVLLGLLTTALSIVTLSETHVLGSVMVIANA